MGYILSILSKFYEGSCTDDYISFLIFAAHYGS